VLGEPRYQVFKKSLDLGDIIGATRPALQDQDRRVTVRVDSFTLVSKALRPLPEKWHGLTDPEQVYRQRYLDLIVNPESRAAADAAQPDVASVRRTLADRKFIEVETPVLEGVAGGAAAASVRHPSQCPRRGLFSTHRA